ncbi:hypothetical protein M8J75_012043 [Diaphorina citri]|nr:hypothetical protein M8J75_012043 [Diaphorina citri]
MVILNSQSNKNGNGKSQFLESRTVKSDASPDPRKLDTSFAIISSHQHPQPRIKQIPSTEARDVDKYGANACIINGIPEDST